MSKKDNWRQDPISPKQKALLLKFGVTMFPETKGEASDLITKCYETMARPTYMSFVDDDNGNVWCEDDQWDSDNYYYDDEGDKGWF